MKVLLESYGYQVNEAVDGLQAVESFNDEHPDLILMDISLPFMDGLTATRIIRESEGKTKIPIIACTAHGKSFYKQAIEAGCDDLINKPLDPTTLEPILNHYLAV